MAKKKRKSRRKKYQDQHRKRLIILMVVIIVLSAFLFWKFFFSRVDVDQLHYPSYIQSEIIDQDGHSRTGWKLDRPKNIVIHYVANPGSSAQANRDFFNSPQSRVSSHFVVGLNGEVIQCIPLDEQSSASNNRNHDTISIEVCHPDVSGQFGGETYYAVVKLTAWLCESFNLSEDDVIRHYDVTGKICPKYYVENPDAWEQLKEDVGDEI